MKRQHDPNQSGLFGVAPARAADELPGQAFLPLEHSCKVYETRDGARVLLYIEHEVEADYHLCIRCGEWTR